jgi:hypothetical protein
MRLTWIKPLRGLLRTMATFTPLKLALWCLLVFALCDLARTLVEVLAALKAMGYGPEFFIQVVRHVRGVSG